MNASAQDHYNEIQRLEFFIKFFNEIRSAYDESQKLIEQQLAVFEKIKELIHQTQDKFQQADEFTQRLRNFGYKNLMILYDQKKQNDEQYVLQGDINLDCLEIITFLNKQIKYEKNMYEDQLSKEIIQESKDEKLPIIQMD